MNKIIEKAINVNSDEFYLVEPELFQLFYTQKNKPDYIIAFLGVSSWRGTSLRSGVWTYYEATDKTEVDKIISFLQKYAQDNELAYWFLLGNHDYDKYRSDYSYPQEWMDESDMIDKWISENETNISDFLQKILKENRGYFE